MKRLSKQLFLVILIISALLLMIYQHVESASGDFTKKKRAKIKHKSVSLKQSLLQDVEKINTEIKILQEKINKTKAGQHINEIFGGKSVTNIKISFNSLSTKIRNAQTNQMNRENIQKLSEVESKGIIIIDGLQQKVGANNKSDSLKLLNELSQLMIGLKSEINKL